jgi:hypothetical protein
MKRILDYLIQHFLNDDISKSPGLFTRISQKEALRIAIRRANLLNFHDTTLEPRSYDWKHI